MPIQALIAAAIPIVGGMVIRMVAPGLLKELGKKFLTRATAAQVKNAGKNIPTATKSQVISQSRVNVAKSKGKLPGRMKDQASGERSRTTPSVRKPVTSRKEKIAKQLASEGKTPRKPDTGYRVGQTKELTGRDLKIGGESAQQAADRAAMNPAYREAIGSGTKVSRKGLYRKSGGSIKPKQYAYGGRVAKYKD